MSLRKRFSSWLRVKMLGTADHQHVLVQRNRLACGEPAAQAW